SNSIRGGEASASHPIRGTCPGRCASAANGVTKRTRASVATSSAVERRMRVSFFRPNALGESRERVVPSLEQPNAAPPPRLKAAAGYERRLEGVGCRPSVRLRMGRRKACPLWATSDTLLDHSVCLQEQGRSNPETQSLCRREIDNQFELDGPLYRQISRLGALE